jgi:putative integral membrane protein (TIGR02587 family)
VGVGSVELNETNRKGPGDFVTGLGRGAAGAMLFGIPMLMTMELWQLGFYIEPHRLFLLLLVNIPLLVLLADRVGFERTSTWEEACRDAMIAYALGIVISAAVLFLIGDINIGMPLSEILGKTAIQAVPAGIGALLGRSQLGGSADDEGVDESNASQKTKAATNGQRHQHGEVKGRGDGDKGDAGGDAVPDQISTSYSLELFLMAVGALFLNLNVAPTEEVVLISYKMTPWHALVMIAVSIAIMHGFVYAVAFKGSHAMPDKTPWWHAFFRFTLPGYIVAMTISFYVLWTFGRLDGIAPAQMLMAAIVLSFPGAIGAAAARLIL